jgi:putative transposase
MRKEKFILGGYYHIYSRIILNTPEFKDKKNVNRLLQSFLLSNSTESSKAFDYLRNTENPSLKKALEIISRGKKLVDVLCYSIMPDHYHLLLRERKENGISEFVRKCNISISKYINIRKERKGPLFESRFNSKYVKDNRYLLHLSVYIHLNALDVLSGREWREHKLRPWLIKKKKLLNYPWSSLRSFLDENHKDLIISGTEIILDQFDDRREYELFLRDWSEDELERINEVIFEKTSTS